MSRSTLGYGVSTLLQRNPSRTRHFRLYSTLHHRLFLNANMIFTRPTSPITRTRTIFNLVIRQRRRVTINNTMLFNATRHPNPLNLPNIPLRPSNVRRDSVLQYRLRQTKPNLTNDPRIQSPSTRARTILIRMSNERRRTTLLLNMRPNTLMIIRPILLPRTTHKQRQNTRTSTFFTLRRLFRNHTTLNKRLFTLPRRLLLAKRPTTRPSTILHPMLNQGNRATILLFMFRNRLMTILPQINLFPIRTRLIRRDFPLQHRPNTTTLKILPYMPLTKRPLTRRSTIFINMLNKSIRIPINNIMLRNNLMNNLPLTIIPIHPIRFRHFRLFSLNINRRAFFVDNALATRPSTRHRAIQHSVLSKGFRHIVFRVVLSNNNVTLLPRSTTNIPRRTRYLRTLSTI